MSIRTNTYAKSLHVVAAAASTAFLFPAAGSAEYLSLTNPSIASMVCIGSNCSSSETFTGDEIRFEAPTISILFDDRSSTSSLPNNDWRLKANDENSSSGGEEYFGIVDVSNSNTTPFRVMAGAPENAFRLGATGNLGLGTAIPQADLHITETDAVTVKLDVQGVTPQSWEMAATPDSFAISYDSFTVQPFLVSNGAPTGSFTIDASGQIGLGTTTPEELLHIRTDAVDTDAFALFDANGAGSDSAFRLRQNGVTPTTWEFRNQQDSGRLNVGIAGGNTPLKIDNLADNNLLRLGRNGKPDEVVVTGTLVVNNTDMNVPDYVFEPGYELPTLAEIDAFITDNGHLPGVPSATEVAETGLDMTQMQLAQLEKIEELTLHVIDLGKANAEQRDRIAQLEGMVATLIADH